MRPSHFDIDKATQIILYVANRVERKDFHKIFKIIYFADREHLSQYGRSITSDMYVAMNDGPVPSKIYDILKIMRGDGLYADQAQRFAPYFEITNSYFVSPKKDADLEYLSQSEVEELDNSLKQYGKLSWSAIKDLSHDFAWRNTAKDHYIATEDILLENRQTDEFIAYVKQGIELQNACL